MRTQLEKLLDELVDMHLNSTEERSKTFDDVLDLIEFYFHEEYQAWREKNYQGPKEIKH